MIKGAIQLEAFFTKAMEVLKLGTKQLLILALITGMALYLPKNLTDSWRLTAIIEEYKPWIGGVFLVSIAISVINIILSIFNKISRTRSNKQSMKIRKKKLHRLTPKEKFILVRYFALNTTSQDLPVNSGVVNELAAYMIIGRSSSLSSRGFNFSYNIQPWAREYLLKHPELLNVTEEEERMLKIEIENEGWNW